MRWKERKIKPTIQLKEYGLSKIPVIMGTVPPFTRHGEGKLNHESNRRNLVSPGQSLWT